MFQVECYFVRETVVTDISVDQHSSTIGLIDYPLTFNRLEKVNTPMNFAQVANSCRGLVVVVCM